jgi:hypothetical protein
MSWIITPEQRETAGNPSFFSNVSLLLHGNGTNGSTTITDNSSSPKTVTAVGNAQISTAQSKFGGASIAFDNAGDYLTLASNSAFAFGTGDFTIEFWVYMNSLKGGINFINSNNGSGSGTNSIIVGLNGGNALEYYINSGSRIVDPVAISTGNWVHVALCRGSGTSRMFKNGSQVGANFTDTQIVSSTNTFLIGTRDDNLNFSFNGYIDDLRITKSVARYTANFTPPAAPFPDI